MPESQILTSLFSHNDRANLLICDAAGSLSDAELDREFEMGMGTLRRTLLHIWAGESVWLQRWNGGIETKWPDEKEKVSVSDIAQRLTALRPQRDAFLASLTPQSHAKRQMYRDSKGSLYTATLGDMVLQVYVHSTHHRAQAVNMLRRLGAPTRAPQVDYMMMIRKPA